APINYSAGKATANTALNRTGYASAVGSWLGARMDVVECIKQNAGAARQNVCRVVIGVRPAVRFLCSLCHCYPKAQHFLPHLVALGFYISALVIIFTLDLVCAHSHLHLSRAITRGCKNRMAKKRPSLS